jgi:hypothetical protein
MTGGPTPGDYDLFFEAVAAAIDTPLRHPPGRSYAVRRYSLDLPAVIEWVVSVPTRRAPGMLRVELFLGNERQRRGWSPLEALLEEREELQAGFARPEPLLFERHPSPAGNEIQSVAVHAPGDIGTVGGRDRAVVWAVDRLVALRGALAAHPLVGPDGTRVAPDSPGGQSDEGNAAEAPGPRDQVDRLAEVCAALDEEPLFHLTLGSKELFHSNLLAWFASRFPDAAREAWQPPPAESGDARLQVAREWHQLDLVLQFPGARPLAIENKVFSLPSEEQLDRYAATLAADAAQPAPTFPGPADCVLLSLSDPGWPHGTHTSPNGSTWRHVSYGDLAERLADQVEVVRAQDRYGGDTLDHYVGLVRLLDEMTRLVTADAEEPWPLPPELREPLETVRLHSTAQKFRARAVAHRLAPRIADLPAAVKSDFTNGQPLLEAFLPLTGNDLLGWQLQGGQFRFALVLRSAAGRGPAAKTRREDVADRHAEFFRRLQDLAAPALDPAVGPVRGRYNHYDPDFVYRYRRLRDVTVDELLDLTELATRACADYADATRA